MAQQSRTRTLTYDAQQRDWVEVAPPPPGTSEGDLHLIRVLVKETHYGKALSAIKKFTKTYGQSDPAYPRIMLVKAEALIGQREYSKAHIVLQEFLGEFGGMEMTSEALGLEFIIADTFLAGIKRKAWGVRLLSGENVALGILDEIAADYPDTRMGEQAIKTKADYLFKSGDHALAGLEYAGLLRDYPTSRHHQFALLRTAEAALASFEGVSYDESALIEAAERYNDYERQYPREAGEVGRVLEGIREMRAEKEFATGAFYQRTDHLSSAIFYYRLARRSWPETIAANKATARLEMLGVLQPAVPAVVPSKAQTSSLRETSDK